MLSSQFNPNIKIKSNHEKIKVKDSILSYVQRSFHCTMTRPSDINKKRPVSTRDVYLSHINLSKILVGRHYFLDHDSVCRDAQGRVAL